MALVFSFMLKNEFVPAALREARTVLIYKKGDVEDPKNWRPVSICSAIRRVFEKVIDHRLREYISFAASQRGFTSTPGTHINSSLVSGCLKKAKEEKRDCAVVMLDCTQAFDTMGHGHLIKTLDAAPLPSKLRSMTIALTEGNSTRIEARGLKTQVLELKRGVFQGSPLSPTLFNLAIDFIHRELADPDIAEKYGFKLAPGLSSISVVGFADDTTPIGNSRESVALLVRKSRTLFDSIGLEINPTKSIAIIVEDGKLSTEPLQVDETTTIPALQEGEKIKYLGTTFSDEVDFDAPAVIKALQENLEKLTKSPLLRADQKLSVLNQYIWPTLVYPLQCAPLHRLSKQFLMDVDKMLRSAVKQIVEIPTATPDAFLYASRKYRGMAIMCASWEAFLQHFAICSKLQQVDDEHLALCRDLDAEMKECVEKLSINSSDLHLADKEEDRDITSRDLRQILRERAFEDWALMPSARGVSQFKEYPPGNKWVQQKTGLSLAEWRTGIKATTNVLPVRALPGRSTDGVLCRHCHREPETLGHVLGACSHGNDLIIARHDNVKRLIANELARRGWKVQVERRGIATNGAERRSDIIAWNPDSKEGWILDPTVQIETDVPDQFDQADAVKRGKYEPCVPYYLELYKLKSLTVSGIYIGARGTITRGVVDLFSKLGLPKSLLFDIVLSVIRDNKVIVQRHLYS